MLARGFRSFISFQYRGRIFRRQSIGEVAERNARDNLFGRHIDEEFPQRLAFGFGVEVPDGINQRCSRQVNDALLGSQPTHLTVRRDLVPKGAEVFGQRFQRPPLHVMFESMDRGDADFITAPVGERDTITSQSLWTIGFQDDVGGRVIRIDIHRVRTVKRCRRWKANIASDDVGDFG